MQDTIERTITVKAPQERVYQAIADPTQIIKWFPDAIEGSFEVGQEPLFNFGEHGKQQIYVEAARPNDYFAFRWCPMSNDFSGGIPSKPNTLIEFRIEETDGVSTVTMLESGFASLPADVYEKGFGANSEGWEYMMGRLEKVLTEE